MKNLTQNIPFIEKTIGYSFKEQSLLLLAFVHRSYANENRSITQHNERLEFLGDSVLSILISEYIYCHLPPETSEGELSYLRSRLVEASSCAEYMQSLPISSYILLGKGEKTNDGRGRESILADLFEALIGAIYLDGGIEPARDFLFSKFKQQISLILKTPVRNWKALLQDYTQKKYQCTPCYYVLKESGPEHNKIFEVSLHINQKEISTGIGSSKKEAQQAAAANALTLFDISS